MKKYSRIVRKIAQTLAAWDVRTVFRQRVWGNVGEEDQWQDVHLVDIIERALQNETIKKSEVERLQRIEKNKEILIDKYLEVVVQNHDLKTKLWDAEQEIHDIKILCGHANERLTERNTTVAKLLHNGINLAAELRKIRADRVELFDDYLQAIDENQYLRTRVLNLMAQQVVHFANELIEPPACLKPLDALAYINGRCL